MEPKPFVVTADAYARPLSDVAGEQTTVSAPSAAMGDARIFGKRLGPKSTLLASGEVRGN